MKKARTLLRKASDYLTMMVLAPILFVISSTITVAVASQVKVIAQKIAFLGALSYVILFLLNLLPYLSIWFLLMILYLMMPNTRIPLRSGILGGIVAGTLFQIVQWVYIKFQIGVASYGAIYGSFAALPLLLAWLQLSWIIVLFGAEIAFANEHYETYGFQPDYSALSVSSKKHLILKVFHLLIKKFSQGEKPLNASQIADALEIPVRLVRHLLSELTGAGLVVETAKGASDEVTFQPGRSIENITVKYALDAYEQYGSTQIPAAQSDEAKKISVTLKEISDFIERSPKNIVLKEI
jgi:membrane protein